MVSTWDINNKRVKSLHINNKEVLSMVRVSDSAILYQKPTNYVLTLTSDKDILSYVDHESATLTATLTDDGVGVPGEVIDFIGLDDGTTAHSKSITANTYTAVGSTYTFTSIPNDSAKKIYLNREKTVYIKKDAVDGITVYGPGWGSPEDCSNVKIEDGILTFTANGSTRTYDISNTDTRVIYSQSNVTISEIGTCAMTDANGEATVSYLGQGAGDLYIKAKCMNLIQTYSIEDCKDFDPMTSNSGKWTIPSAMSSAISYNSNGMTVSGLSGGQSMYLSNSYNVPVTVEFDLIASTGTLSNDATPQFLLDGEMHNNNSLVIRPVSNAIVLYDKNANDTVKNVSSVIGHYKLVLSSTSYSVYIDDTLLGTQSNASLSSTNMRILSSSNRSFTIKNLKIKPSS